MGLEFFNGYRFKENMNLVELNDRISKLRKDLKEEQKRIYKKRLLDLIYLYEELYFVDKKFCEKQLKKMGYIQEIHETSSVYEIAFNLNYNYRSQVIGVMAFHKGNTSLDYGCKLQIFPINDKILFQFIGEKEAKKILNKQPDIEEYSYGTHIRNHENINEDDWDGRLCDWKKATQSQILSNNGFYATLFDESDIPFMLTEVIPSEDEYGDYKKSLDERALAVAKEYCVYPGFLGNNYEVFFGKGYQEFLKIETENIKRILETKQDPLKELIRVTYGKSSVNPKEVYTFHRQKEIA